MASSTPTPNIPSRVVSSDIESTESTYNLNPVFTPTNIFQVIIKEINQGMKPFEQKIEPRNATKKNIDEIAFYIATCEVVQTKLSSEKISFNLGRFIIHIKDLIMITTLNINARSGLDFRSQVVQRARDLDPIDLTRSGLERLVDTYIKQRKK
jgi:hypothetical protein